jgi:hypothetical protein
LKQQEQPTTNNQQPNKKTILKARGKAGGRTQRIVTSREDFSA